MKTNRVIKSFWLLIILAIVSCNGNDAKKDKQLSGEISNADLKLTGGFYCYWWFENEMGFDINNIPPKKNYLLLNKWEFSDPVAVPHPDSVDFKLTLINSSQNSDSILIQYISKIHYLNNHKDTSEILIEKNALSKNVFLRSHDSLTETFNNIPVGLLIDSLMKQELTPLNLEVEVSASASDKKEIKKDKYILPIIVGD